MALQVCFVGLCFRPTETGVGPLVAFELYRLPRGSRNLISFPRGAWGQRKAPATELQYGTVLYCSVPRTPEPEKETSTWKRLAQGSLGRLLR